MGVCCPKADQRRHPHAQEPLLADDAAPKVKSRPASVRQSAGQSQPAKKSFETRRGGPPVVDSKEYDGRYSLADFEVGQVGCRDQAIGKGAYGMVYLVRFRTIKDGRPA